MKYVLFASTALATVALGTMASAQGMTLFGDARGGLRYDEGLDNELQTTSRFRFGVLATAETDAGLTLGAEVRADNAIGGEQGREGNFFVSGSMGTLTFGDTAGADERQVGDVPGNLSLTGLGDQNETLFLTNGGDVGGDDGIFDNVPDDEFARPTIRYDYDVFGFGVSLSSNRTLKDWSAGIGYDFETGLGGFNVGLGYADIDEFTTFVPQDEIVTVTATDGDVVEILQPRLVEATASGITSWSASVGGTFETFEAGVTYIKNESDDADFDILNVGAETFFGAFGVGAYYTQVLSSGGNLGEDDPLTPDFDEDVSGNYGFAITSNYDLGGGAQIAGGFGQRRGDDENWIGDFGVKVDF